MKKQATHSQGKRVAKKPKVNSVWVLECDFVDGWRPSRQFTERFVSKATAERFVKRNAAFQSEYRVTRYDSTKGK